MPMKRELYPDNWLDLRRQVQERAGNKCEVCGVSNYELGARDRKGEWHDQSSIDHMNSDCGYSLFGEYPKIIRIVCTTAHLDHDPSNNDLTNLKFLCQRCHLAHDKDQHKASAAETRMRKAETRRRKKEEIQPALF